VSICVLTRVGLLAAWAHLVDVVLGDAGGDHGETCKGETARNALNGCEIYAEVAKSWVDDKVHQRTEEDDEDRVQIGDNVVRDTLQFHDCCLGGQVIDHLAVGEP